MSSSLGILFALGSLFGWAFGDFYIQRATRVVGSIRALFYIAAFGTVALLPFVWNEILPAVTDVSNWPILIFAAFLVMGTAVANFEGLRQGKLSVVLPINGIELLIAIGLAIGFGHERYNFGVYALMAVVILGLMFTTVVSVDNLKRMVLEKGALWAILGAIGLGATNYIIGLASRTYSPLFTIWFTHTAVCVFSAAIMLKRHDLGNIKKDFKKHLALISWQSILDNFSWVSYAYATVNIPIGIATTVSEGYLAVGTLLGVVVNKEKLLRHQIFGIALTIIAVLALGFVVGG